MAGTLEKSIKPKREALRNDDDYNFVSAWEYMGEDKEPHLHKEKLTFEFVELKSRSYK